MATGSDQLRADATHPSGLSWRSLEHRSAEVLCLYPPDADRVAQGDDAATAGAAAGPRQGCRSRSIAQQRTSSLRARATIACFLRARPALSRRYTDRAHGL